LSNGIISLLSLHIYPDRSQRVKDGEIVRQDPASIKRLDSSRHTWEKPLEFADSMLAGRRRQGSVGSAPHINQIHGVSPLRIPGNIA
jgi:hypothetical protein